MKLAVLGAGGHGRDVQAIAEACGHIVWMLDDDPDLELDGFQAIPQADGYLIGVNDPTTRFEVNQRLADGFSQHPRPPLAASVVHPSASVDLSAMWGRGVVVAAQTQVGPDTMLHNHVHVGPGVTVTRSQLDAFTTVAPGANIAGDVTIGKRCSIGIGANISHHVTLADDVTLGAGAVVPPGTHMEAGTYVGAPARRLK